VSRGTQACTVVVDQLSARATPESESPAADIVQHLQGPLLHVANDPRGGVVIIGLEGEAAVLQDAQGVELYKSCTTRFLLGISLIPILILYQLVIYSMRD